ncbi:MAG: phosphatase [bacterium]|nr:phosphatase [bacterium]
MLSVDLHIHTLYSGHAYGTIEEMALAARRRQIKIIAITDHGPAMPGAPHRFYFGNLGNLPPFIHGVEVLRGVEANVISHSGEIDLANRYLEALDWVAIGLHDDCLEPMSTEQNTHSVIAAIETGLIDVVVHPGNPRFPLDYEKLVLATAKAGIAIEINNSSLVMPHRRGSAPNCLEIAELAAKHNVKIVLGSDAHSQWQIGDLDEAHKLALQAGVRNEQILNYSPERVKIFLQKRGKKRYANYTAR